MNCIVYIETARHSGSGVILKCDCEESEKVQKTEGEESYIILTNYHVLQELKADESDQKKCVDLEIMDTDGNIVNPKYISHVYFASGNNHDNSSDAAALLVVIKNVVDIDCCNDVHFGYEEREIFSEGYPYVFQEDVINRQLHIRGKVEKYNKQSIGIYKIMDDYHWYLDANDKDMFEGLSGAPVFIKEKNVNYLIGINQSFCNIGEGKNPFKMVYFLNIQSVLEWLRSQGIIIFEYYKQKVKILWLNRTDNKKSGMHVVLLGGSGAGKSSFIKSLCLNGRRIDASGDGQTTRTTITYNLNKCCKKPNAKVSFMGEEEFKERQLSLIQLNLFEYICCYHFGMKKKDIIADNTIYLKDMLLPLNFLEKIRGDSVGKIVKKICDKIDYVLYICGEQSNTEDYRDKIYECYRMVFEKIEEIVKLEEIENILSDNGNIKESLIKIQYLLNRDQYLKYITEMREKNNNWCKEEKQALNAYFNHVMGKNVELKKFIDAEDCEQEFKTIINKRQGFFDINEFKRFFQGNDFTDRLDEIYTSIFYKERLEEHNWKELEEFNEEKKEENVIEDKTRDDVGTNKTWYGKIGVYYEKVYQCIEDELEKKHHLSINKQIEIVLEEMSQEEQNFLTMCLRTKNGMSLTSLIKNICIEDSFANEYALYMIEQNVEQITFYDTYGIDHVDQGNQNEIIIQEIFDQVKEHRKSIDAFFYIKKLDSGKPEELRRMLPIINRIQPSAPLFCIFTGMDQFIVGKEIYCNHIKWSKENYESSGDYKELLFPKAVSKLYEDMSFVESINVPDEIREKIYDSIVKNIIPYASKYQINDDWLIENNRKSLDQIFRSILIDEWNGGFVSVNNESMENEEFENEMKEVIKHDLHIMFGYASETNWNYKHHMTVSANYRRIYRYDEEYDKRNVTLGYFGSWDNRWDTLLKRGFDQGFIRDSEIYDKLEKIGMSQKNSYNILVRLRDMILFEDMREWENIRKTNKTNFRNIFEEMYKEHCYKINIFQRQEEPKLNIEEKRELLNDVCDFEKGLENEKIEKKFTEYFYQEIVKAISSQNKNYFERIRENDNEFSHCLNTMTKLFSEYSHRKIKNEKEVWSILKEITQ